MLESLFNKDLKAYRPAYPPPPPIPHQKWNRKSVAPLLFLSPPFSPSFHPSFYLDFEVNFPPGASGHISTLKMSQMVEILLSDLVDLVLIVD